MKKRLKEIEEEAGALREMQAKVEKEMGAVPGLSLRHTFFCPLSYMCICTYCVAFMYSCCDSVNCIQFVNFWLILFYGELSCVPHTSPL